MYKIVGADQKEYGPVTEEQVREWIAEGRANAQTIVRFGDGPWKPLSTFPEFSELLRGASSTPSAVPPPETAPPFSSTAPPAAPLSPMPLGAAPQTNGFAIAGVICGVVGLFCCGPIFSTVALVLSFIALSQINQNPTRYTGKNLALVGIGLALVGYILFAFLLFTGLFRRTVHDFRRRF
ncbi:MAG: DUF4190 domain-containing protein [Verrucomicrobiia bacterium]